MATDGIEGSNLSAEIRDSIDNLQADDYNPFVETLMISEDTTGDYSPEANEGLHIDESYSSVDNVDGISYIDMMTSLTDEQKYESISIKERLMEKRLNS